MRGLLKFITCGSVDDGKSTLIGRLLYDAKLLYTDQKQALELESRVGGRGGEIDYSLLLDGLIAEREQGITIDVAYRYFTTRARSFIVADTPGHDEYTRNMAVGASFAELAVILVDASRGVLTQTRRHARICALMGIRCFVFAVNKMDLVGCERAAFDRIASDIMELKDALSLESIRIIPLSATGGDNVTRPSERMPWYSGETLISSLENVDIKSGGDERGFYMPVQRVCRPDQTFRGFQGQVECGTVRLGDEVTALPSGEKAIVKRVFLTDRESAEASAGRPVTLCLDREVDVSRGCVLARDAGLSVANTFTVSMLWMDDAPLVPGMDYLVKTGTKTLPGVVTTIRHRVDVDTGERLASPSLTKNELGLCDVALSQDAVMDAFKSHRTLGEVLLIDRVSNATSACGVIETVGVAAGKTPTFRHGALSADSGIFDEFYCNLTSNAIQRLAPSAKTYGVGDGIPAGESCRYPENFDVIIPESAVAVSVRGGIVDSMVSLSEYEYSEAPLVDGHGFGINVSSAGDLAAFLAEYANFGREGGALCNKWLSFGAYRSIVFR
ncbi:MAG: sulfate adenylyltransferase subunit CysN [Synergistaceae bacterium]|jgi:sulfate adenylyltransferase subunit 1|nr:sulfate adenylyltransferase subunit CysN [Synergistaceae bacterium]